jgi:hypothetical protein
VAKPEHHTSSVKQETIQPKPLFNVTGSINSTDIPIIIDSGSQFSLIPYDVVKNLNIPITPISFQYLQGVGLEKFHIEGSINITLNLYGINLPNVKLLVIHSSSNQIYIGKDLLMRFSFKIFLKDKVIKFKSEGITIEIDLSQERACVSLTGVKLMSEESHEISAGQNIPVKVNVCKRQKPIVNEFLQSGKTLYINNCLKKGEILEGIYDHKSNSIPVFNFNVTGNINIHKNVTIGMIETIYPLNINRYRVVQHNIQPETGRPIVIGCSTKEETDEEKEIEKQISDIQFGSHLSREQGERIRNLLYKYKEVFQQLNLYKKNTCCA